MNTKTEGVHEAMLKEILKKWRMKSDQYFNEKIQEDYWVLFGKKRRWSRRLKIRWLSINEYWKQYLMLQAQHCPKGFHQNNWRGTSNQTPCTASGALTGMSTTDPSTWNPIHSPHNSRWCSPTLCMGTFNRGCLRNLLKHFCSEQEIGTFRLMCSLDYTISS